MHIRGLSLLNLRDSWLLEDLLLGWVDLLVTHRSVPDRGLLLGGVLVLGPLLDLVVCALNELVPQVEKNRLGAFLNDLSADAFEWVSLNVDSLDRLVEAEPVGQRNAIIVDHC